MREIRSQRRQSQPAAGHPWQGPRFLPRTPHQYFNYFFSMMIGGSPRFQDCWHLPGIDGNNPFLFGGLRARTSCTRSVDGATSANIEDGSRVSRSIFVKKFPLQEASAGGSSDAARSVCAGYLRMTRGKISTLGPLVKQLPLLSVAGRSQIFFSFAERALGIGRRR